MLTYILPLFVAALIFGSRGPEDADHILPSFSGTLVVGGPYESLCIRASHFAKGYVSHRNVSWFYSVPLPFKMSIVMQLRIHMIMHHMYKVVCA